MPDAKSYRTFVLDQGKALRDKDEAPKTLPDWMTRRKALRQSVLDAMGSMPEKPCELSPRVVATLKRKGYRIENLVFQTRPDVWMTASAFVPDGVTGKVPAVLCVHGHWPHARREPRVQSRCIGLAKLGIFVLLVDAFSAGERHPASAGYHGTLLGASLWPAGLTLLGVQAYDNRRAVDYLATRPEVDSTKLGITGASGGGNQTMYAGATDERFKAVVPVCSVGTYQAYLRAACCVCEVLPGALRFTEEGDVLGLVAPRALMVVNATKDAFQFSVGEAKKSVARAESIFKLYEKPANVKHAIFESPHDYNKAMREAMYGWMLLHLAGKGDGSPVAEPEHETEKVEDLACYPDKKRPAGYLFPPGLAAREARGLLKYFDEKKYDHPEAWEAHSAEMQRVLAKVLNRKDAEVSVKEGATVNGKGTETALFLTITSEKGIELPGVRVQVAAPDKKSPAYVVLDFNGRDAALSQSLVNNHLIKRGPVFSADLRATGSLQPAGDAIGGAPDHNSAEHALWLGRPLLSQWLTDVEALITTAGKESGSVRVVGFGQAGVLAILAGAVFGKKIEAVAAVDVLSSFVTPTGFADKTRMGMLVPGILRAGDVPHLAALIAPRRLVIAGAVTPEGKKLDRKGTEAAFAYTARIYAALKAVKALTVGEAGAAEGL